MDHFQDLGEGQDVGQVAHDEIVVDPRPRNGTRKGLQHLIDVERLVRGRVDRGELGEGQQDDGGMDPGVALDGVHLAVPLGDGALAELGAVVVAGVEVEQALVVLGLPY